MIEAAIISSVFKGGVSFVKKNPLVVLAIVVMFGLIIMGYQCGVKKGDARTAKILEERAIEVEKKTKKLIDKKLEENKVLKKDNEEKDKVIAKAQAENVRIEEKMKKDAERLEGLERVIEIAPPETLLGIVREVLKTNEVWYNADKGVFEFSLKAFRTVAAKLGDWEDFTLNREPDYKKKIKNLGITITKQAEKILNLNEGVENLGIALAAKVESYNELKLSFDNIVPASGKSGSGFWGTVLHMAVGYGTGKLAEAIF